MSTLDQPLPLRPRPRASATSLLLTVLGEFVRPGPGALWTSTLIEGLATVGVESGNARQAAARLADQGFIRSERVGRRARWHLTETAQRLLGEGAERIYGFGRRGQPWDGHWSMVVCSVPEEHRAKRHQLRTGLGFAGYGFVEPSVAVSPHVDREAAALDVLGALRLDGDALILRVEAAPVANAGGRLAAAWDLDAVADAYRSFLAEFDGRRPASPDARFGAVVELVHAWRRFPFLDPELPAELLPDGWPGTAATALFDRRRAEWSPEARAWFETREATP